MPAPERSTRKTDGGRWLSGGAFAVSAICLLPMLAVVLAASLGDLETFGQLARTVLPEYVGTTLLLVALVAVGTAVLGTGCAWLVTMTRFPGVRIFEVALALPFAFPAYVLAYAYTDVLDHPGIVQTTLREVMGWGPRDYWFPEIRSVGGAALMLILVLYPYVYLLTRAAFLQQSSTAYMAARTLGRGPWGAFFGASLPLARPAIIGGVLLAIMETLADFGTVSYFGVQTFATAIYRSWVGFADRGASAQLALCLLGFALLIALLERMHRGSARHHNAGRRQERPEPTTLLGAGKWGAVALCSMPVSLGFVLPVLALFAMGLRSEQDLFSPRYLLFVQNSLTLSTVAALTTVAGAVLITVAFRLSPNRLTASAGHIARIGYAVPGGVIAVGLIVPFAAFDNALDAFMEARFGIDTGLLFTGSIWLLVAAYTVRFLAAALNTFESGMTSLHPNLDSAARSLGSKPSGLVRRLYLPALWPSVATAALIVFVDVMKELPATLIMRPFNMDTLAVQAHRLASDERLEGAAVPSLVLVAVGLVPVILLCRALGRRQ
ncbi:MAG: iron ABC transporter permease [Pseudomonadota bacterium]